MSVGPYGYEGRRVIVSGGGGSGMGAAVVEQVGRLGGEAHVLDLREPNSNVASFQRVDLRDPAAIESAVDAIAGRIDALFNCVGVPGPPFFSEIDTMLINFAGVRLLTERVVARMDRGGAVASIASAAAAGWRQQLERLLPLVECSGFAEAREWCEAHRDEVGTAYTPSKVALVIWTAYACQELGGRGIRINCTLPGPTDSPMLPEFKRKMQDDFWESYPIPLGRFQTPDEQARALVFLNSDAASAITGAALLTDGGTVSAAATGRVVLPALRPRSGG